MKKLIVALGAAVLTVGLFGAPTEFFITDVEAKGFSSRGGSSFSRSSFRSSSGRSSGKSLFSGFGSSKSKSSKTKTAAAKTSSKKGGGFTTIKGAKSTKTGRKNTGFASSSTAKTKGLLAQKRQQTKFKAKPKPVVTGKGGKPLPPAQRNAAIDTKYRNNPIYNRAGRTDSGTYWNRRNQYYGGYSPPMYVYNSAPSFGMWDTIFLYSMMSNMNNASQFAHNHQNDADYQQWRAEADKLAEQNAELRGQLAAMDAGAAKLAGTAVDPSFLPTGVDADIALTQDVREAALPNLRVCVGSDSGAYHSVTARILGPNLDMVNVAIVNTEGAGQALEYLTAGKCDSAWVQGDSYWNFVERNQTAVLPFERVSSPFKEAVHLICTASGPSKISKLGKKHKVWFPAKSGAAETWANFIGEDSSFGKVQTVLNNSSMVVHSNEEALLKVNDSNNCMMYVAAPGATKFMAAVEKTAKSQKLVMIDLNDGDLNDTTDPAGEAVYTAQQIDSSTYPNLARQNGMVFGSGDIDTLFLNADFIIGTEWKKVNGKVYPKVALQIRGLETEIDSAVGQ